MKKVISLLLLSLVLSAGSFSVSAKDKHHDHHKDSKHRYEYYKDHDHGHKYHHMKDYAKDMRKLEKERYKRYNKYHKDRDKYYKRQHKFYRHYHSDRVRDFWGMVYHAAGGAHNVSVWQISDDCYMVRYYRNGRMYIRTLNPYTSIYGAPSLVSNSWNPNPLWMLLPRVNINIDL